MADAVITAVKKTYGGANIWGGFLTIEVTNYGGPGDYAVVLDTNNLFDASELNCAEFDFVRTETPMEFGEQPQFNVQLYANYVDADDGPVWVMNDDKTPEFGIDPVGNGTFVCFVEFGREWSKSK